MSRPSAFLGDRLLAARTASQLSREQVAVAIGKSWASVRAYELGAATPPLDVLSELASVLGVTVGDLVDERVPA